MVGMQLKMALPHPLHTGWKKKTSKIKRCHESETVETMSKKKSFTCDYTGFGWVSIKKVCLRI